jgi:hypothetical protein
MIPSVSDIAAIGDGTWFDVNPGRRYHIRPGRAIRRRPRGVLLRTPLPALHRYVEASAERAWWDCAYPHLSPEAREVLAREARKAAKANRGTKAPRSRAKTARQAARGADEQPRIPSVDVTSRQGAVPGAPLVPALGGKP